MTKKLSTPYLKSRRATLQMLGAAGIGALAGSKGLWITRAAVEQPTAHSSLPGSVQDAIFPLRNFRTSAVRDLSQISCVTKPALTEGPFFVDERLNRSDIRTDPANNNAIKPGTPFTLKFNVSRVTGTNACTSLIGAWVDLWHCDALGGYSDVSGQGNPNNLGQKWLRGYQVTDNNGEVTFQSLYPGWYQGRTTHLHYKVRLFDGNTRTYDFTSQLTFDDALTDVVYQAAPYNTKGARGTRNNNDGIAQQGGSGILLNTVSDGSGGYTSTFSLGLTGVPATVASVAAVSAASYASGGGLSPNAIAALFGTGMATSTAAASTDPLPTTLAGATVIVRDSAGTSRTASLFFVSPTQINFLIPPNTANGAATVIVQQNGATIGQGAVTIQNVAPGIFTANATGNGIPAALALRVRNGVQTYEAIAQFDQTQSRWVALPIDLGPEGDQVFLVAYGTGFRNSAGLTGATCAIGGASATVGFLGAQGSFAGLDQANILLPRSLAGRGTVELNLSVDGRAANPVSLTFK
ncbi:MAG: hypothetical protein HOP19_15005 [Acidobacteria bacterium]|nr:hypothetical protein [Acidobacteriota bacterium]